MYIRGKVAQGLGMGKTLGYPTANLDCVNAESLAEGVYAARATLDGMSRDAVAVVGAPAQLSAQQEVQAGKRMATIVEVHILDYSGNLYGKELEVEVLEKISEIAKFEDETRLKEKIKEDVRKARICLQG